MESDRGSEKAFNPISNKPINLIYIDSLASKARLYNLYAKLKYYRRI